MKKHDSPVGRDGPLLGEVIAWTCVKVGITHSALCTALTADGLDPTAARELAPRHAFARACHKLSDQRIIRQVDEDAERMRFQFTAESRDGDRFEYVLETVLSLDKRTGRVTGDRADLVAQAQSRLDEAIGVRTGGDVTRVIQRLFDRHADLFPVRPQGGVYFVPSRHSGFVDKVQSFLGRIGGHVLRFPVPAGTPEGDRSVRESVAAGLSALIAEHRRAVAEFGTDTRDHTLERAADRIRQTRLKVEGYAELLDAERERLDRELAAARAELVAKVEAAAAGPVPA